MEGVEDYSEEERKTLRRELEKNMKGRSDALPEALVNQIFCQPPQNLCRILRTLTIEFGPFSLFSLEKNANDEDTASEVVRSSAPIIDRAEPSLITATRALEAYNKFVEQKTGKFKLQTVRSLALMQASSPAIANIPVPGDNTTEAKLRNLLHAQTIVRLRAISRARNGRRPPQRYVDAQIFMNEVRILSLYDENFEQIFGTKVPEPGDGQPWVKYDKLLKNIDEWTTMIMGRSSVLNDSPVKFAHDLVDQIVTKITDHCKTQLATVYHETTVADKSPHSDHRQAIREEAEALASEIDWLTEELVPVAHMCVSAQFLRPLTGVRKRWEVSKKLREAAIVTYASGVMRFLNQHVAAVAERTEILVYHHQALRDADYVRRLKDAGSLDTVPQGMPRTMAQGIRRFRKDATAAENFAAYMKMYANTPIDVPGPYAHPTPSVLDRYVQARTEKGENMMRDLHKLFEAAVKAGLTDRDLGGELLIESLLADSCPDPAQEGSAYKDSELESSIALLRSQAHQIKEMFKELNLDGIANAPDFVAHAYRQNVERLDAKDGEDCFRRGENRIPRCLTCVRCLKFEQFLRRWGA